MSTSRMTLCVGLTLIPQLLKDLLCIMSPTMTSSTMWMNTCHMQAEQATTTNDSDEPCTHIFIFDETDAMLLEFVDDLDNFAGGSSSVRDNSKLEHYVAANGQIPTMITPGAEKPIFPHVVRFSQAIGVCVRKTFSIRYLKYVDIGRIHRGCQGRPTSSRFVEHQMLSTFKEFWGDCHRHFKKYSDPEEACVNPPHLLVGRNEN
ncbi:CACTA en-spm transposon protein [Cucumis melo var. makuwa]|uniref:CACTA en-spm transposon protein n=1 Tax=Cucumis melo var. makuwa TaxID=1194695 RepID=A0A5A7TBZ5_CUCMM|nr:CACTA en-spm transposon protein [Cucumis melo var. makuwa]